MRSFFARLFLWYIRVAARIQLSKIKPLVIGIGGSAGKTSLVAALHAALATTHTVRSGGGVNSESGIPLGILGIKMKSYGMGSWFKAAFAAKWKVLFDWNKYEVYVAELGIDGPDEPRNMAYMLKIVMPQIGVLTNIALEHSERFEHEAPGEEGPEHAALSTEVVLDRIAAEEERLLTDLPAGHTAIVNLDDPRIALTVRRLKADQVTVSTTNPAAVFFGRTVVSKLDSFYVEIIFRSKTYDMRLARPLSHAYASTLLLAVAAAHRAGVAITDAIRGINEGWQLPPGRLSVFPGVNHTTIIDSSYNATPVAVHDALGFLQEAGINRRRIAILGDMRELGRTGDAAHTELVPHIKAAADHVILIGQNMQTLVAPKLKELGVSVQDYPTFTDARAAILEAAQPENVILIKGSQNTLFLERAVELLLADKADGAKLCRRGAMWDAERAKTP